MCMYIERYLRRLFQFFAVVAQKYEVDPIKEHAIKGNNAIVKCQVPSYVADFLTVTEWQSTDGEIYTADSKNYGSLLRKHI